MFAGNFVQQLTDALIFLFLKFRLRFHWFGLSFQGHHTQSASLAQPTYAQVGQCAVKIAYQIPFFQLALAHPLVQPDEGVLHDILRICPISEIVAGILQHPRPLAFYMSYLPLTLVYKAQYLHFRILFYNYNAKNRKKT